MKMKENESKKAKKEPTEPSDNHLYGLTQYFNMVRRDIYLCLAVFSLITISVWWLSVSGMDNKINAMNEKLTSINDLVVGIINNKYFSNVVYDMSKSVVLIRHPSSENSDKLTLNAQYVDEQGNMWDYGTGFVIKAVNTTSYILTAYHVVDNSSKIEIVLTNGTTINAMMYKPFADIDVAIISAPVELIPVKMGKSEDIKIGAKVAFTGYPLGGNNQVTHEGIISFIGARAGIPTITINSFVNGGNSGGPLFLADSGEVIGVINARETVMTVQQMNIDIPENFSIESRFILQTQQQIFNLLSNTIATNAQVGIGIARPIDQTVLTQCG